MTLKQKDPYNPYRNPNEDHYADTYARFKNSSDKPANNPTDPRSNDTASRDSSDPRDTAHSLKQAEEDAIPDSAATDTDIKKQEEQGQGSWKTNITKPNSGTSRVQKLFGVKKVGIATSMIGVVIILMGLLWSIVIGALGLVNLKETAVGKISMRANNVMERVEEKVLLSKRKDPMNRNCGFSPLKCRYRGFSDKEIKRYNNRAAEYGWRMESKQKSSYPPFRNKVVFQKIDSSGKVLREISPEQYTRVKRTDPTFAKADAKFYKGKVEFLFGKAAKGVLLRTKSFIGKRATPNGSGDTEEERQKTALRETVRANAAGDAITISQRQTSSNSEGASEDPDADRASNVATEVIDTEIEQLNDQRDDYTENARDPPIGTPEYSSRYDSSIEKIDKAGSSLASTARPLGALQNVCMVRLLLATANQARAIGQTVQLIRFAIMYSSLADRIKAGDADGDTSQQINLLMGHMTKKGPNGMTAFDSAGYGWVSTGAIFTNPAEDIGKYQNGGPAPGVFGAAATKVLNSREIKTACAISTSRTALALSIAFDIGSLALGLFSFGAGTAASQAAKQAAVEGTEYGVKTLIKKMVQKEIRNELLKKFSKEASQSVARGATMTVFFQMVVPPLVSSIARSATNTVVTGDEEDEEAGNAYISGVGAMVSQVSKAQGMEYINTGEAVSQDNIGLADQVRSAKTEGVNHLDLTNDYSFAKKFSSLILPTTARIGSASSIPMFIAGLNTSALSLTQKTSYAAVNQRDQYEYCIDDEYKEKDIATDPFCNPQLGMNTITDPEETIDYLLSRDLVSDDGTPQGEFSDFIEKCMNTNSPIGDEDYCTEKNNEKYTMMRSYCLHTSVDVDMNGGEGVSCSPALRQSSTETTPGTQSPTTEVSLSDLYKPSENIACSDGTRDLGIHDGYHAGSQIKIRLCAIDTIPETGEQSTVNGANGKLVVNSRTSSVYARLANDAKTAGVSVSAAEGFRTMERQQYFWDLYQSGRGNLAARPGYSNHQAGVAVDWSPAMYTWLSQGNAENYGLRECTCGEQWHYSFDGK